MNIIDKLFLLLTGLVAIYMIYFFFKKNEEEKCLCNWYFIVSFLVLLVSGLLLIFSGWGILGNNLVAIVASLIPFSLALGLISKFYKEKEILFSIILLVGLILIAITRFGILPSLSKIVYPLFHAIAGLTIFFVPILKVKSNEVKGSFIFVSLGGALIGIGGIALAFLKAGKQLLFFSQDVVLMILAPLLFFTALFYAIGFIKEK